MMQSSVPAAAGATEAPPAILAPTETVRIAPLGFEGLNGVDDLDC